MEQSNSNPVRTIVTTSVLVFLLLLAAFLALTFAEVYSTGEQERQVWTQMSAVIATVGARAWEFIRPLLQLAVLLLIVDWLLGRLGIAPFSHGTARSGAWSVQAIIALIIVGALGLAALSDVAMGLAILKDLALVVVGFYFGTQKRSTEIETPEGKVKTSEEHENPRIPASQ
jgi:hypothetical protein